MHRDPLVKCIWSNMMLGWFARQYDIRLVFLIRHPGAVIESELRNDWRATFALDRFRTDTKFRELTQGRYDRLLNRELTAVEELAAHWLIENQWALELAPAIGAEVVHYEHLKSAPAGAWERVRRALRVPRIPSLATLAKPSQQSARTGSAAAAHSSANPRWMASLTKEDKLQIQSVLDRAACDLYSMEAGEPLVPSTGSGGATPRAEAR